jgi:hypothetical protein
VAPAIAANPEHSVQAESHAKAEKNSRCEQRAMRMKRVTAPLYSGTSLAAIEGRRDCPEWLAFSEFHSPVYGVSMKGQCSLHPRLEVLVAFLAAEQQYRRLASVPDNIEYSKAVAEVQTLLVQRLAESMLKRGVFENQASKADWSRALKQRLQWLVGTFAIEQRKLWESLSEEDKTRQWQAFLLQKQWEEKLERSLKAAFMTRDDCSFMLALAKAKRNGAAALASTSIGKARRLHLLHTLGLRVKLCKQCYFSGGWRAQPSLCWVCETPLPRQL